MDQRRIGASWRDHQSAFGLIDMVRIVARLPVGYPKTLDADGAPNRDASLVQRVRLGGLRSPLKIGATNAAPARPVATLTGVDGPTPSPSPVPARPLVAKVGFELENTGVKVEPFLQRGTVLLRGSHWQLETDTDTRDKESHLEWVFDPLGTPAEIDNALGEVLDVVDSLRNAAGTDGRSGRVRLRDVCPTAAHDCALVVEDARFGTKLQATYGIGLADLNKAIDALHPPRQARAVHEDAARISRALASHLGEELTPSVKGFIELLSLYLNRATGGTDGGTVHICFRMMARSDFCAIYDQLLNARDRTQVTPLLQAPEPDRLPVLMEALNLRKNARVFSAPYVTSHGTDESGPRVKDWLRSIAVGREGGTLRKDLLSPPPGYPLHQGGPQDYGMGALGIDQVNRLVLFEIRGAPHRPDKIPMNGQIKHALMREYADAQAFNSSLPPPIGHSDVHDARYALLNKLESLLEAFKALAQKFDQAIESTQGKWLQNICQVRIPMARRTLADCEKRLVAGLSEDISFAVAPHFNELRHVLIRLESAVADPQVIAAIQRDLHAANHAFGQELWRLA